MSMWVFRKDSSTNWIIFSSNCTREKRHLELFQKRFLKMRNNNSSEVKTRYYRIRETFRLMKYLLYAVCKGMCTTSTYTIGISVTNDANYFSKPVEFFQSKSLCFSPSQYLSYWTLFVKGKSPNMGSFFQMYVKSLQHLLWQIFVHYILF